MSDTPRSPRVAVDSSDGVARIALDSPHNRNALSDQLVRELHDALAASEADHSVRTVVLTHTGGTFCAGADLTEASSRPAGDPARQRADQLVDLLLAIVTLAKPVVGRIDGHPQGLRESKSLVNHHVIEGITAYRDRVAEQSSRLFESAEAREGMAAFLERRPPRWAR